MRLDAIDVADRLRHAGIPCDVTWHGDASFDQRIRLESGLSVLVDDEGLAVGLWSGSDPLTGEVWRELSAATNAMSLPSAIARAEADAPRARAAMLGENRDVLGEVRDRLRGWNGIPPTVLSEAPVAGRLAVSMRGRAFSGWLDGARLPSVAFVEEAYRKHWHGDARPEKLGDRFFPVEGDGFRLVAVPRGLSHVGLEGIVSFREGEAWFKEAFHRREDRGRATWTPVLGGSWCGDVAGWEEKGAFADRLAGEIERHYERRFDAFAEANVRARERRVLGERDRAQEAEARPDRLGALHRERHALRDLAHAEAERAAGRPLERAPTAEEEAFPFARARGGLRLVADRAEDR